MTEDEFFNARFGLFIHWGIYAVNGWHEQEQFRKKIARVEYAELMEKFNPVGFNPDRWLDLALENGMSYVCFTAKHIDGFCLWDTAQTRYNVMHTPFGKDTLRLLSDACRRRNIPLCLYYSIPDMHCKYYPSFGHSYERKAPECSDEPSLEKYLDFVRGQVTELCTNYGKIAAFWWDANQQTLNLTESSVNALIRKLQPGILINNRGFDAGDFSTPERDFEGLPDGKYIKATEACESVGAESWGYRSCEDYFSAAKIQRSMAEQMMRGANYLLNIGPNANGEFPHEAKKLLAKIGDWRKRVSPAFEVAEILPVPNKGFLLGKKGKDMYLLLTAPLERSGFAMSWQWDIPSKAILLNNGEELHCALELMPSNHLAGTKQLHLGNIPIDELANEAIVIKLIS